MAFRFSEFTINIRVTYIFPINLAMWSLKARISLSKLRGSFLSLCLEAISLISGLAQFA